MSRIKKKFLRLGTGTDDLNSRDVPANFTPTNYTPAQVASEGTDKVSAHLKGIDNKVAAQMSNALTSAHIFVGNGSNVATDVAMSGDISISNTGATSYSGTVPLNKGGTGQTTKAAAFDALQPMTTAGDIIYGGASGTGTRLAIGSTGQFLGISGSSPAWSNPPMGSGNFNFVELPGTAPLTAQENGAIVYKFISAGTDELYACIKVPKNYVSGNQINLYISGYSPSSSNTILILGQATLIRSGTDSFASTTNQRTTTNTALTNTVASQLREFVLDITSSTGQINSVNVSAGDIIKVRIYRGSDSDTADIRVLADSKDVKFN